MAFIYFISQILAEMESEMGDLSDEPFVTGDVVGLEESDEDGTVHK